MMTQEKTIQTSLGGIHTKVEQGNSQPPLIFLHGVFLDHSLWSAFGSELTGRTHIYLDMPSHGKSTAVGRDWTLDECATMLIECLNALHVKQCIAIGHSWGSMTILRAAAKHPQRFLSLGLFNMPFTAAVGSKRLGFTLQKMLVGLPHFYGKQAAQALYTSETLQRRPEYATHIQAGMLRRPAVETARTIDAVILQADDATEIIQRLQVPAVAIMGESDYVGQPPHIPSHILPGGHVTPHEAPEESAHAILAVVRLAEKQVVSA